MTLPATASSPVITLVSPFPRDLYPRLRKWLDQFPERTMDDFWPRDFAAVLDQRAKTEFTAVVIEDGEPVGFLGYARLSPHLGSLRGVFFDKSVHGNGTAVRALRKLLQTEFDAGVHKINAFPFADNGRAIAFYHKLGAVDETTLREHTLRRGALTDIRVLAFFAPKDGYK